MGASIFEPWHLIIILVIVLIIFGAGKLPEVGGALGKGIKEFKEASTDEADDEPEQVKKTEKLVASKPSAPISNGAETVVAATVRKSSPEVDAARASDV